MFQPRGHPCPYRIGTNLSVNHRKSINFGSYIAVLIQIAVVSTVFYHEIVERHLCPYRTVHETFLSEIHCRH